MNTNNRNNWKRNNNIGDVMGNRNANNGGTHRNVNWNQNNNKNNLINFNNTWNNLGHQ